ncbi:Lipid phosphate phosphatase [Seminavis robusta]|uniref:Lipid phosphate phosphatase n=1 Tax=Seminavis robusta TaxID=568900 RepID=A0A9N8E5C4_9STRA|nr:Lipid phosphate phosphatase [Seminavis robusta]|eukprot:Sro688_g187480.1 Lipid phosphate phosphatase (308) ;mRNA; f:50914-51837
MDAEESFQAEGSGAPESPDPVAKGEEGEEALLTDENEEGIPLEDVDRVGRRVELALCVLYVVVVMVIFQGPLNIEPTERPIPVQYLESTGDYIRNLSLDAEHNGETISDFVLILCGVLLPLIFQLILAYVVHRHSDALKGIQDRHCTLCAYFTSFATNLMVTEFLKAYCGSLRPLYYYLCQPDEKYEVCLQESGSLARDARKSFPSGHASISFSGLVLLTLYLNQKYGTDSLRNNNPPPQVEYYRAVRKARCMSLVALLPMALALFFSSSRLHDNEHFAGDVVGGAVIGFAIGYYFHTNIWFCRGYQ